MHIPNTSASYSKVWHRCSCASAADDYWYIHKLLCRVPQQQPVAQCTMCKHDYTNHIRHKLTRHIDNDRVVDERQNNRVCHVYASRTVVGRLTDCIWYRLLCARVSCPIPLYMAAYVRTHSISIVIPQCFGHTHDTQTHTHTAATITLDLKCIIGSSQTSVVKSKTFEHTMHTYMLSVCNAEATCRHEPFLPEVSKGSSIATCLFNSCARPYCVLSPGLSIPAGDHEVVQTILYI